MQRSKHSPLWGKLFSGSGWTVVTIFLWECVEEGLETLIAFALSSVLAIFLTKLLSTVVVIAAAQGLKFALRNVLTPLIRQITYKEGNDKVEKLKQAFKWLFANKCTVLGVGVGGVVAFSGAGLIDVSAFPELLIGEFNVTPLIYYGVLGALGILASFFPETVNSFAKRVAEQKAAKEQKSIEREAMREFIAEEKANDHSKVEREQALKQAESERQARVAEAKRRLIEERNAKNQG